MANGEIQAKLGSKWVQIIGVDAYPIPGADDATAIGKEEAGGITYKQGSIIVNLAGQRLSKMQKGVNVVNGKKVLK